MHFVKKSYCSLSLQILINQYKHSSFSFFFGVNTCSKNPFNPFESFFLSTFAFTVSSFLNLLFLLVRFLKPFHLNPESQNRCSPVRNENTPVLTHTNISTINSTTQQPNKVCLVLIQKEKKKTILFWE